ncbi:MAG: DUF433 domain-containing protein [Anaerolineae bacterium]|nr:DUF433 domain-containing protein [Anaerolineae bacterium]
MAETDTTLYQITQGTYQTYREVLEDALEWGRYRAYTYEGDVHISGLDGGFDRVIARGELFFRIVYAGEESLAPSQEEALVQSRERARQKSEDILIYDYNERLLAKLVWLDERLFEEFYPSDRIAISQDICMGQPCIANTHIQVWLILDQLADGWTAEEIVEDYEEDNITIPDVMACLDYASKVLRGITFTRPL